MVISGVIIATIDKSIVEVVAEVCHHLIKGFIHGEEKAWDKMSVLGQVVIRT